MIFSKRSRKTACLAALLLGLIAAASASAEEGNEAAGDKHVSGMSILGNDESPKSLVIVPWKSSDLGSDLDLARRFGQDRTPLDPEVFRRGLDYHAIRSQAIRSDRTKR